MSTDYEVKSVSKAVAIITALADNSFKGMTREELAVKADINYAAAYRMLKTLESHGWVRYSEATKQWQLDAVFMKISRAYERFTALQLREVEAEHLRMTGEEISNGKK